MTRFAKSIGVAAQLLTFSAQATALDVAPSPGFSVTYGGCRACEEGVFACAHNADGPALGLFTTIGFSDFEPDAAPTSNEECGALCAADEDCIGYEIRIPQEGKPALCENWKKGADGTNAVYPQQPQKDEDYNFRW